MSKVSLQFEAGSQTSKKDLIHTIPLMLIIAMVGLISFLLIFSAVPQGGLFGTLNPKPASQAAVQFSCTQVLGFAQSYQWWYSGSGGFDDFQSVIGTNWQMSYESGWPYIEYWTDPNNSIWTTAVNTRRCIQNSNAPDRIVLNITSDYHGDVNFWKTNIQTVIANIRSHFPSVRQIVLQSEVGGPNGALCPWSPGGHVPASAPYVRGTYNFIYINQAIDQLVGGDVVAGARPKIRDCADFTEWAGHLNSQQVRSYIGQQIADFYNGSITPPSPTPRVTLPPTPAATPSCPLSLLGDTDCNGAIDIHDFNAVVSDFNKTGSNILGDVDHDNDVDIHDFNAVVSNFGRTS